ncbi:MAG TPA: cytochrome c oxidase assembly factor Coa1 family protein [Thermoanaerobaculia bacterium]|nr:cytochrome c oxidase assembly factor Coa1 family protein [Thermoanaerobaculia bacterium]
MTAANPQYIPPQPQGPQPPQQQKSGCLKWLLIGCSIVFVLFVGFVAVVGYGVVAVIKRSDAYKGARDRAINDPRVIAALGAPVEAGWWVKGSLTTDNGGHANIDFPISGPKNKATVIAVATINEQGKWVYTRLQVDPDGGPPIDLLQ